MINKYILINLYRIHKNQRLKLVTKIKIMNFKKMENKMSQLKNVELKL